MNQEQNRHNLKAVIRIVGIYILFSSAWVYLSDSLLESLLTDPKVLMQISIYKGLLFILCTATLLYLLISRYARRQKQAELELRRYYDIVDRMQVGLYVYRLEEPTDDRSLRLITANPASTGKLGLPFEVVVGQLIDEVFPHLRDFDIPRRFAEVARTGQGFEIEGFGYSDARISKSFYSFKVFPLPERCVGVLFEDITQRQEAEERLRNSEEQFRTLCDFAPIGIFKADRLGNNTYSNQRWTEISGWSAEEALGQGWLKAIHPDDRDKTLSAWTAAAERGENIELETRYLTPQGRTIWGRVLSCPIRTIDNSIIGYVGTIEDITDLRRAREEILKTQKLESLELLAGGIAHDFNNFLMTILSNITLAGKKMDDPEMLRERLTDAERAASRAKRLTKQLLTFARGGEPVMKVVDLKAVLREAVDFGIRDSTVTCVLDLADNLSLVEADEGQLYQVFHNLVLNAIQAMPDGGTVTVLAENIRVSAGKPFVRISITDTGTGISEEHLPRVFDPYFTTKQKGSGLGLATCQSIISKHGGSISVVSEQGRGSTFRVLLPALVYDSAS